jgi:hypothetical protein
VTAPRRRTLAGPFRPRGLASLLDDAHRGDRSRHVSARETGQARTVPLPSLPIGQHLLARIPVVEIPAGARWNDDCYLSITPWVCEFHDVLVHSDAGIVCAGQEVVADTLGQTDPERHHYLKEKESVMLAARGPAKAVSGRCLSLLNFSPDNYYHWTIDGIGRLAAADKDIILSCQQVLLPKLVHEFQTAGFERTGLHQTHAVRTVAPDETLRVECLVVPWGIADDHRPHPRLHEWFAQLPPLPGASRRSLPRRFYIDRRGTPKRRLVNEDDVIAALARMDFVPVRLEAMRLRQQIGLFQSAEVIVAPHGAGLANLVYAQPGCKLIELHTDSYVNWCARRIAAVCQVAYDCVIGRQLSASGAGTVHSQQWMISITHLLSAVEQMLAVK